MVLIRCSKVIAILAALFGLSYIAAAAEWPQWRGPDGEGHAVVTNLPVTWSESQNVAWKTPLPGRGWSSSDWLIPCFTEQGPDASAAGPFDFSGEKWC